MSNQERAPAVAIRAQRATAVGSLIRLATLGALAYAAFELVVLEFRLGARGGIRSLTVFAVPLLAGGYVFANHRAALERLRRLPGAVRFALGLVAGALAMASLRFFSALYPLPLAELAVASCIAAIGFGSGSLPGLPRPLAPAGIAAGMLGYVAGFGLPGILV